MYVLFCEKIEVWEENNASSVKLYSMNFVGQSHKCITRNASSNANTASSVKVVVKFTYDKNMYCEASRILLNYPLKVNSYPSKGIGCWKAITRLKTFYQLYLFTCSNRWCIHSLGRSTSLYHLPIPRQCKLIYYLLLVLIHV